MAEPKQPDWYLRDWMRHLGKRQSSLVNELGWEKGRASKTWNGKVPYRRELVNELSAWLGIAPFELLMPPKQAESRRQLRAAAEQIVAETASSFEGPPQWATGKTGTE